MQVAALYQHEIRIEERPIPEIGDQEILLKIAACGLCGTDILKIKQGNAPHGVVLGHEVVGTAIKLGSAVTSFQEGERVVVAHHVPCGQCRYCRHGNESMCAQFKQTQLDPGGFAEYLRIPASHVKQTAFRIPANLSNEETLFMEPLACCVRAVRRSALQPGDCVIVIGLGSIGMMMTQTLLNEQMKVITLDLMTERMELATRLGAIALDSDAAKQLLQDLKGADMVLFTGGTPQLLNEALPWVRNGGKLHLFSSLGGEPLPFPINELYHRELTVLSTYSSTPPDLRRALALLASRFVTPKSYGWEAFALSEIPAAVDKTVRRETMKAIIYPTPS